MGSVTLTGMRVALTTQKPDTLTGHAGRCRRLTVFTAVDGRITDEQVVEVPEAETLHQSHTLPAALGALDAFITGSMGEGLFARLTAVGVRPFITSEPSPRAAVQALLAGTLTSAAPHAHHQHGP